MADINAGIIALLNVSDKLYDILGKCNFGNTKLVTFESSLELYKDYHKLNLNVSAIIAESEVMGPYGVSLLDTLKKNGMGNIPFFLLSDKLNENQTQMCLQAGVADVFLKPLNQSQLENKINFILKNWTELQKHSNRKPVVVYKTPLIKRIFDVFFAGMALLCLSPLLIIIMIAMKIESKGPIFYYSLRVGTGYRIFKFYKLRSMFVNADKRLKELQHLNQYNSGEKVEIDPNKIILCDECAAAGSKCRSPLYADGNTWCEKQYLGNKKLQAGSAFFKLKNDPRITKVGNFIRNTSIDELPQLWNVIKGDMSIVGNRPLPLYEAEKLTTDKYAPRFLAPAGLTGLWQVEKRGKGKMSEEERLMLDNTYAQNHNFWYDIKLILKTIPALFQKENV